MKIRFFRWYNVVLTALLSVLGFSSCSSEPMDMYGTPSTTYQILGNVTDEEGNLISGILVSAEEFADRHWYNLASKKTNHGEYYLNFESYGGTKLIIQDVDGEDNGGEFASDTIDIDYKSAVKVKEGEGWNSGTYKITQNIQLKKK